MKDYTGYTTQRAILIEYLQVMIARNDWHGVANRTDGSRRLRNACYSSGDEETKMNDDEVMELAQRAGTYTEVEDGEEWLVMSESAFPVFAKLIIETEREKCAQLCERMAKRCNDIRAAALEVAAEYIRAGAK
jgi:hypothetical protein